MKITFKEEELEFALSVVRNIINPQSTLPILSNVLVSAKKDKVTFIGSDLESCVRCEIAAEVQKDGETTLPAAKFYSIVQEVPAGAEVSMALKKTNAHIEFDSNEYELTTISANDFPKWPEVKEETSFELPQAQLRALTETILFAIPQKDPRRALLGGYFKLEQGGLTCVGTDGKRLGHIKASVENLEGKPDNAAIVPHKALQELQRVLAAEGNVRIKMGPRQLAFEMGNITLVTNKIEATYPNYELVIPKDYKYLVRAQKEELARGIKRASVISEEKTNAIVVKFAPEEAVISSMSPDLGSYKGSVAIEYTEEEFEIAFNFRFILEILRLIGADKVELKIKSATSPVIINAPEQDNPFFLVMPIRIAELTGEEESA